MQQAQENKQSKDAHANYCKQSVKYREYVKELWAWVESLGFPSLSMYIAYKYGGANEFFVSPPTRLELRSNAPTPSDLDDATYIDEEEDDLDKKPPAKKQEYRKEGQKPGW